MTVYLIHGAPASGKTTEAKRRAKPGDIIIDSDLLAEALGSPSSHDHPAHVKSLAMHLRDVAVAKTAHQACDVYIVSASPNAVNTIPHDTAILCDPGMGTCLARAKMRPKWTTLAVKTWYQNYDPEQKSKRLRTRKW